MRLYDCGLNGVVNLKKRRMVKDKEGCLKMGRGGDLCSIASGEESAHNCLEESDKLGGSLALCLLYRGNERILRQLKIASTFTRTGRWEYQTVNVSVKSSTLF